MGHKSKLKAALEAHQGKDRRLEYQKKVQKKAVKAKRRKSGGETEEAGEGNDETVKDGEDEKQDAKFDGKRGRKMMPVEEKNKEDEEGSGDENQAFDISHIDDSESDSELEDMDNGDSQMMLNNEDDEFDGLQSEDDEERDGDGDDDDEDDDEEDVPLSDLASVSSTAKEDIIPHQRLQINNTTALLSSLRSFSLPISKMPFSEHQSITTTTPVTIPDINDDLNRELTFYKQSLDAVQRAHALLKTEGLPFSRPADYFAEMVKSDEHMGRIKEMLVDEAARKKASAEARKQRDLKKFGKQVQVAKLQERDRAKRETLDRIQTLKRKRQNPSTKPDNDTHEEENDPFAIALEDTPARRKSTSSSFTTTTKNTQRPHKRQKRDEKFGFGGKKRFAKSGDAISSGDLSGFSAKKKKSMVSSRGGNGGGGGRGGGKAAAGRGGRGGSKRLGKSRRAGRT